MDGRVETYIDMTNEEVARLVLSLILEEMLKQRLAVFRLDQPSEKPVYVDAQSAMVG